VVLKLSERILYEDNHLLVLNKPGGLLVQRDRTGDETLLDQAKQYLKVKYHKPGNVFLALVHRLDRVSSGVLVLARTSKAAARLSAAFRERRVAKFYLVAVEGRVRKSEGLLEDHLSWDEKRRKAKVHPTGQRARLRYRLLRRVGDLSLLLVRLETGRKHQIRAQFAHRGHPVVGDWKYGSRKKVFGGRAILLHAWSLVLPHPTRSEEMRFTAPLPAYWPQELKFEPPTLELFA